jgi:hypothetical protein
VNVPHRFRLPLFIRTNREPLLSGGSRDQFELPGSDGRFNGVMFGWLFTDCGPDNVAFNRQPGARWFQRGASGCGRRTACQDYANHFDAIKEKPCAVSAAVIATSPPHRRPFHFHDPNGK